MPQLAPPPLTLSDSEQAELQHLVNRHTTPQQIALRARIILQASQGLNHRQIARNLDLSRDCCRLWRRRWMELSAQQLPVLERLQDAARPGAPATFTLEQLTQLYAMACQPPQAYGRPISHWTPRELALELVKQGIVESISPRHVGRLLEEADLKPHQKRYWLNPPPTQSLRKK